MMGNGPFIGVNLMIACGTTMVEMDAGRGHSPQMEEMIVGIVDVVQTCKFLVFYNSVLCTLYTKLIYLLLYKVQQFRIYTPSLRGNWSDDPLFSNALELNIVNL